jgi:hypothetical protein
MEMGATIGTYNTNSRQSMSKKYILPSLASILLFNTHLLGDETTVKNEQPDTQEHVAVQSREIDPSKREHIRELRAKEREEAEQQAQNTQAGQTLRRVQLKLAETESQFMLAPRENMARPQFSLTSFALPIDYHLLMSASDNLRSLEMEDGSHWEVSAFDSFILRNWGREDTLVVTPNYNWFGSYNYYITNKSRNTYVKANLVVGPLAFGPFSHWVVEIDNFNGHIFLENQMVWCVNPQDSYALKDWAVNDHVIIGLCDTWFSSFDHILINVNVNDHVRAKQY